MTKPQDEALAERIAQHLSELVGYSNIPEETQLLIEATVYNLCIEAYSQGNQKP